MKSGVAKVRCILMLFAQGAEVPARNQVSICRTFVGIDAIRIPHEFPGPFFIVTCWEGPRGLRRSFDLRHRSPAGMSGRVTGTLEIGPNGKGTAIFSSEKMI